MKKVLLSFAAFAALLAAMLLLPSCSKVDINYSKQVLYAEIAENYVSPSGYTASSYEKYNEAYMAARAVYEQADATALDVDRAREKLVNARKALVKSADFSQLKLALDAYRNYDSSKYTEQTFQPLTEAYERALAVYKNGDSKQSEINASVTELMNTMGALERIPDDSALKKMLESHYNKSDYTSESYEHYEEAYNYAKELVESGTATKIQLMGAEKRLSEATKGLIFKGELSSLQSAYDRIVNTYYSVDEKGRGAKERYTKASYHALQSVMDRAQTALKNGEASEEEINDLITGMNYSALELVDITSLLDRIDLLDGYSVQSDNFTDESYARLLFAVNEGIKLKNTDSVVTANDIKTACTMIDQAVSGLERKDLEPDHQKNKSLSVQTITVGNAAVSLQNYLEDYSAFFNQVIESNPSLAFYTEGDSAYFVSGSTTAVVAERYFKMSYNGGYPVSASDRAAATFAGVDFGTSEFEVSSAQKLGAPTEYEKRTEEIGGKTVSVSVLTYENEVSGIVAVIVYDTDSSVIRSIEITAEQQIEEPSESEETPASGEEENADEAQN